MNADEIIERYRQGERDFSGTDLSGASLSGSRPATSRVVASQPQQGKLNRYKPQWGRFIGSQSE